jgi:hypothetical protein
LGLEINDPDKTNWTGTLKVVSDKLARLFCKRVVGGTPPVK